MEVIEKLIENDDEALFDQVVDMLERDIREVDRELTQAVLELIDEERREIAQLRRLLRKKGYLIRKSRIRNSHADNLGGYMILDAQTGFVVRGAKYELDKDDIKEFLN